METMTIHFKNGMTKTVVKEVVEAISNQVIKGCGKFQTFSDKDGNLFLVVNLDEIVFIS